jgi:hypothetical protein
MAVFRQEDAFAKSEKGLTENEGQLFKAYSPSSFSLQT